MNFAGILAATLIYSLRPLDAGGLSQRNNRFPPFQDSPVRLF
jgi:hypothetical protein